MELEGDERDLFLDAECEGDENLRKEIESLLGFEENQKMYLKKFPKKLLSNHLPLLKITVCLKRLSCEAAQVA